MLLLLRAQPTTHATRRVDNDYASYYFDDVDNYTYYFDDDDNCC